MLKSDLPENERERLLALKEYELLDTEAEKDFDDIVALASFICQTPMASITLIDEHRQWFKSQVGLRDKETPRDVAFCSHAILKDEMFIVNDATKDNRFHDNPLVTGHPDIRFYAGIPLTTEEGYNLGTICVIDTKVRELTPEQNSALKILRNQVLKLFELRRKNQMLTQMHELHQRLLSIIGHDLRSPLNSIHGLVSLAEKGITADDFNEFVPRMRKMVDNTRDLLNNLLHWAKNHIEGKFTDNERLNLNAIVSDVIQTMSDTLKQKNNVVNISIAPDVHIHANRNTFEFVLRNLVQNANKFTTNGTITLTGWVEADAVNISILDSGVGIPQERIDQIFTWGKSKSTKGTHGETGSGLGLPMVKEFISEMGGKISVKSVQGKGTTFLISLPADNTI